MMTVVRRYWKIALMIVAAGAGISMWISASRTNATNATISTSRVRRKEFVKDITSSGKTKADRSVSLRFQTSGRLAWVGVKEGETVRAGQALASLDSREVQKTLEKALRDYSATRNDFEQTWRVTYDGRSPSDALTDTVRRILEKNQWSLEKAVLDVELKSLAVEYATLITPISGIVTSVDTPVAGVNITPATAEFSVSDITSMVFEANVDETDVGALAAGQKAIVSLDAFPESTFSGTIVSVAYTAEISGGGATVFPVKIMFDEPKNLRIGLNGDMTVVTEREPDVLVVPAEAIRESGGSTFVYRKSGNIFEKVPVRTGSRNEDEVRILDGLADQDEVAIKGFTALPK